MATFNDYQSELWIKCPYDSRHRLAARRYVFHLQKCPSKQRATFRICPYNASHRVPLIEFSEHLINCVDNRSLVRNAFEEASLIKETGHSFLYKNLTKAKGECDGNESRCSSRCSIATTTTAEDRKITVNRDIGKRNCYSSASCSNQLRVRDPSAEDWNNNTEKSFRLSGLEKIKLSKLLNQIKETKTLPSATVLKSLNKSERRLCYQMLIDCNRNSFETVSIDSSTSITLSSYSSLSNSSSENSSKSPSPEPTLNSVSTCSLPISSGKATPVNVANNSDDDNNNNNGDDSDSDNEVYPSNKQRKTLKRNTKFASAANIVCQMKKLNIKQSVSCAENINQNENENNAYPTEINNNSDAQVNLEPIASCSYKTVNTPDSCIVYKPLRRPRSAVVIRRSVSKLE